MKTKDPETINEKLLEACKWVLRKEAQGEFTLDESNWQRLVEVIHDVDPKWSLPKRRTS